MHLLLLTLVLALFFGADCLYFAGLVIGGEVIGMVLLMSVIIYLIDRFHQRAE
jgi:putative effector of murein hydrolase LrgA (UPF0299 family)